MVAILDPRGLILPTKDTSHYYQELRLHLRLDLFLAKPDPQSHKGRRIVSIIVFPRFSITQKA